MTMRTNCILLLVILLGAFPLSVHADESGSIILYTPYTKISVTPGASIDYSIVWGTERNVYESVG